MRIDAEGTFWNFNPRRLQSKNANNYLSHFDVDVLIQNQYGGHVWCQINPSRTER